MNYDLIIYGPAMVYLKEDVETITPLSGSVFSLSIYYKISIIIPNLKTRVPPPPPPKEWLNTSHEVIIYLLIKH